MGQGAAIIRVAALALVLVTIASCTERFEDSSFDLFLSDTPWVAAKVSPTDNDRTHTVSVSGVTWVVDHLNAKDPQVSCLMPYSSWQTVSDDTVEFFATVSSDTAIERCFELDGLAAITEPETVEGTVGFLIADSATPLTSLTWNQWRHPYRVGAEGQIRPVVLFVAEQVTPWLRLDRDRATDTIDLIAAVNNGRWVYSGKNVELRSQVYDAAGAYLGTHGDVIGSNEVSPVIRVKGRIASDANLSSTLYVAAYNQSGEELWLKKGLPQCRQTCIVDVTFLHQEEKDVFYGFWIATDEDWDGGTGKFTDSWDYWAVGGPIRFCHSADCSWGSSAR